MSANLTPNAASPEYAVSLTPDQRILLCDLGYYNEIITGYLILAMQNSGFTPDQIEKAVSGLERAFDWNNATEAQAAYRKF